MQRSLSSQVWISVSDGLPPSRSRKPELQTKAPGSLKEGAAENPSNAAGGEPQRPSTGGHWKKATRVCQVHSVQLAKPTTSIEIQTINA